MASKISLIAGSLLIVGVAVVLALALSAPEAMSTVRFSGSEASLKALSVEAKLCGISDAKVERIGKFLALTVQTTGPSDAGFECLVGWVLAHPQSKIGFLGNGPSSTQTKP